VPYAHMTPRPFCVQRIVWAVKIFILNWPSVHLGSVFTESRLDRCKHNPFASNPAMKYWRSNPILSYLSIVSNGSHDEDRKYWQWLCLCSFAQSIFTIRPLLFVKCYSFFHKVKNIIQNRKVVYVTSRIYHWT